MSKASELSLGADEQVRKSTMLSSISGMYHLERNSFRQSKFVRIKRQSQGLNESDQLIVGLDQNYQSQIQISELTAWILLFMCVIMDSLVACWMMADVRAQSITRNSWRFLTVAVLLVPFVMYENRQAKTQEQKFVNCLTKENLRPIFVSSINYAIWLTCLLFSCKWTSLNHSISLTGLRFYMISIIKVKNGEKLHMLEVAGNILCTIGLFMVLTDSVVQPQDLESDEGFRRVQPWKRLVIGDSIALAGSVASVFLNQHHKVPDMPRFSYLFLYNLFLSFNLITSGYFFGSSEFTFHIKYGVFGLFTYHNFVSVVYVSVLLGLYLLLAHLLISQIFNDIIINVSTSFESTITCVGYKVLGLQTFPPGMTCIGYSFLLSGLIFVIGGQGTLQNKQLKINYQLFRQTSYRFTTTEPRKTYKKSFSVEKANDSFQSKSSPAPMQDNKMPFEMILEQDDQDLQVHNIQKKKNQKKG